MCSEEIAFNIYIIVLSINFRPHCMHVSIFTLSTSLLSISGYVFLVYKCDIALKFIFYIISISFCSMLILFNRGISYTDIFVF